jgi:hypothetical protein
MGKWRWRQWGSLARESRRAEAELPRGWRRRVAPLPVALNTQGFLFRWRDTPRAAACAERPPPRRGRCDASSPRGPGTGKADRGAEPQLLEMERQRADQICHQGRPPSRAGARERKERAACGKGCGATERRLPVCGRGVCGSRWERSKAFELSGDRSGDAGLTQRHLSGARGQGWPATPCAPRGHHLRWGGPSSPASLRNQDLEAVARVYGQREGRQSGRQEWGFLREWRAISGKEKVSNSARVGSCVAWSTCQSSRDGAECARGEKPGIPHPRVAIRFCLCVLLAFDFNRDEFICAFLWVHKVWRLSVGDVLLKDPV